MNISIRRAWSDPQILKSLLPYLFVMGSAVFFPNGAFACSPREGGVNIDSSLPNALIAEANALLLMIPQPSPAELEWLQGELAIENSYVRRDAAFKSLTYAKDSSRRLIRDYSEALASLSTTGSLQKGMESENDTSLLTALTAGTIANYYLMELSYQLPRLAQSGLISPTASDCSLARHSLTLYLAMLTGFKL